MGKEEEPSATLSQGSHLLAKCPKGCGGTGEEAKAQLVTSHSTIPEVTRSFCKFSLGVFDKGAVGDENKKCKVKRNMHVCV